MRSCGARRTRASRASVSVCARASSAARQSLRKRQARKLRGKLLGDVVEHPIEQRERPLQLLLDLGVEAARKQRRVENRRDLRLRRAANALPVRMGPGPPLLLGDKSRVESGIADRGPSPTSIRLSAEAPRQAATRKKIAAQDPPSRSMTAQCCSRPARPSPIAPARSSSRQPRLAVTDRHSEIVSARSALLPRPRARCRSLGGVEYCARPAPAQLRHRLFAMGR